MFYVSLMVGVVALAVNLIALIRRRKRLSKLQFFVILLYFIAPNYIMLLLMELMLKISDRDGGGTVVKITIPPP